MSQAQPGASVVAGITRWSIGLEHALREFRPSRIIIRREFEGDSTALQRLAHFAEQIEYLSLPSSPKLDLGFVSDLVNLRELWAEQMTDDVSFAELKHLSECSLLKPAATLGRIHEAPSLAELHLWSVPLREMGVLAPLVSLRRLSLRQVDSLTTLDGIQAPQLELLELIYNRRLKSVATLRGMSSLEVLRLTGSGSIGDLPAAGDWPNLKTFSISSGPPIGDFAILEGSPRLEGFSINSTNMVGTPCSVAPFTRMPGLTWFGVRAGPTKGFTCLREVELLGEIPSLEYLLIDRGPDLPDIQFLRALTKLTALRLTRTTVLDGDLSPVLALPALTQLELNPHRKHYSHTFEALVAAWNSIHQPTDGLHVKRTGRGAERGVGGGP